MIIDQFWFSVCIKSSYPSYGTVTAKKHVIIKDLKNHFRFHLDRAMGGW